MLKIQNKSQQRSAAWVLAALLSSVVFHSSAQAQSSSIFENATLSPSFSPNPKELRGISGGSVPAKEVARQADTPTGSCVGFMDAEPDHTLELKAFFSYLSIQVQSPEDTTIVVRGPGGTWCNDDLKNKNAGIEGQWLQGTYQIWVGTYGKDKATPYLLQISQSR